MLIHELTSDQCRDVLSRAELGRLACARFDQPYVVPIHFSFDPARNCVYAFSTVGQKIQWMRENPKVCLAVDEVHDKDVWTTVLAFGRYEELEREPEEGDARGRAEALFAKRNEWWLPAAAKVGGRDPHEVVVYRIQIDRVTGRRAGRQ
jgi:nitroimidazol reductase NimA-like FMN-containing flavoprotein (pyridoxamine 5'-phosphate oxidase superfamily)